MIKSVATLRT